MFQKNELVTLNSIHKTLALVLDTKDEMAYIVYVAGRGHRIKHEPFWIDKKRLIPYQGT